MKLNRQHSDQKRSLAFLAFFCLAFIFAVEAHGFNEQAKDNYLALIDPEPGKKHSSNDVTFSTIDKGAVSGISTRERLTIKEETTWISVWSKHAQSSKSPRVVPHVDFERDMVLAVFQGDKSGYNDMVHIEKVRLFKDKMVVLLGHQNLGAEHAKSTLRSYHIVSLPKTSLPVVFH